MDKNESEALAALTRRMEEVEAENSALRAQMADLAAKPARSPVPAPSRRDEGPRIFYPLETPPAGVPSDAEADGLLKLLRLDPRYRHLLLDDGSRPPFLTGDFDRPFRAALRYVNTQAYRMEVPNKEVALSWWCDAATGWCKAQGIAHDRITGGAFIAACVASGDVKVQLPNLNAGIVFECGLSPHRSGRAPNGAWRRVLETGRLPDPYVPRVANEYAHRKPEVITLGI
jgi:hypothetical protein